MGQKKTRKAWSLRAKEGLQILVSTPRFLVLISVGWTYKIITSGKLSESV